MYLLEGEPALDHATIARFRTSHFAKCSRQIFSNMAEVLHALGQLMNDKLKASNEKAA